MKYAVDLILQAMTARNNAYAPYSHFKVGAALLAESGKIYTGINIECAAYSVCNCAERTALFKAVSEGEKKFLAVAVAGGKEEETSDLKFYCPPCGVCRQALREFCDPGGFKVILAKNVGNFKIFTFEELLPYSFGPDNLN